MSASRMRDEASDLNDKIMAWHEAVLTLDRDIAAKEADVAAAQAVRV